MPRGAKRRAELDFTRTIFDVIDARSFSNLWFWIVVAFTWSSASHWVLGVPHDLILRARRQGGPALSDLEDLVRINVGRILYIARTSGLVLLGLAAFGMTALGMLAFWYDVEFAQAVALIAAPMAIVAALSLSTARRIEREAPRGDALFGCLARHRRWTQGVGVVAIFVTAMFGMYRNLAVAPGF